MIPRLPFFALAAVAAIVFLSSSGTTFTPVEAHAASTLLSKFTRKVLSKEGSTAAGSSSSAAATSSEAKASASADSTEAPTITFVTGNTGKLRELRHLLDHDRIGVNLAAKPLDLPELQKATTAEIAKEKVKEAYKRLRRPVLVEDSSLSFNALGGMPGPYIKWFEKAVGVKNLPRLIADYEDKTGYATCIFGVALNPKTIRVFEGRCPGNIVPAPRGEDGFGFDPIFEPTDLLSPHTAGKTFAELPTEDKNAISHRSRAVKQLVTFLNSKGAAETLQKEGYR